MEKTDKCAKCNEEIKDDQCVIVEDQSYHTEHFTCDTCGVLLGGKAYI